MNMDNIFDHVVKDHNLATCNIEEELHIAAKLGRELLLQHDSLSEKNRILWEVSEERAREIEMLRNQNKALRCEADTKASEHFELERKNCEMEQRLKLLEKEVIESHSLIVSLSESVSEAERLCVDKTRLVEELSLRISELEHELDTEPQNISLALSPLPRDPSFHLNNHISRLEEGRLCLEEEVKSLVEENTELFEKMQRLEDYQQKHSVHCSLLQQKELTDTPDTSALLGLNSLTLDEDDERHDCSSDVLSAADGSMTSDSWLTEKLTTLEDWHHRACESCICGACESVSSEMKAEKVSSLSYRELFDEVFEVLRSIKHLTPKGTPRGTPKGTVKKITHNRLPISSVFDEKL